MKQIDRLQKLSADDFLFMFTGKTHSELVSMSLDEFTSVLYETVPCENCPCKEACAKYNDYELCYGIIKEYLESEVIDNEKVEQSVQ